MIKLEVKKHKIKTKWNREIFRSPKEITDIINEQDKKAINAFRFNFENKVIRIKMKPIKYIKSRHEHERITKWLDKTKEVNWIKSELERLKKSEITAYVISRGKNLAICRKGLTKIQGQYN